MGLEVALRIIDGKDLNREQYEVLKSIAEDIPIYLRLEYAQLLYEYGDAEEAEAYVKGTVERVLKGESPTSFGLCSFPKEATPLIIPILKEKPEHAIDLANGLVCHEGGREHIPALVGPLRDIVFDSEMELEMRVSAAFALLRLGVDPLKKEK